MPAAIRDGKLQAGDAFGGALGEVDPIFLLSSLPFVATSVDKAHRLADLARADYAQAFEKQGQHLLYITLAANGPLDTQTRGHARRSARCPCAPMTKRPPTSCAPRGQRRRTCRSPMPCRV
jgi:hypothetical protein